MSDIVARAKEALAGVTDGPWEWEDNQDQVLVSTTAVTTFQNNPPPGWPRGTTKERSEPTRVLYIEEYDKFLMTHSAADAAFIASARGLVPELIAEIERLRGMDT